jgi:valyl-tRNA synthetase
MDFGTGALKVTPAHDMNDNQLGQKHGLEVVDIFNEDGTLNSAAEIYVGLDRFDARKKIAVQLEEEGYLWKKLKNIRAKSATANAPMPWWNHV